MIGPFLLVSPDIHQETQNMNRIIHHLVVICSFLSIAGTARAASPPVVDCKSAHRDLAVDYGDWVKAYREACNPTLKKAPGRGPALGNTVHENRQLLKDITDTTFSGVPSWTDAEIMEQFVATRDERYMYATDHPYFRRRISWLYPDDGCFARAEQVVGRVSDAGKPKPYKLWAFGPLRVYTPNHPDGVVGWGWHVVPLVKNSDDEPIVLDAAISPCKPLPWRTWLATMVDDMSAYDDDNGWNGVSVSDSNAYMTGDLAFNDPDGLNGTHRATSLSDEQTNYLLDHYFDEVREWGRQLELHREPTVVLGLTPPWSGSACTFTEVTYTTIDIAASGSASAIATCPFATLNVGGGFMSSTPMLLISKNARLDNGWEIVGNNTSTATQSLAASAVCLTGAPQNASVSTVTGATRWILNNGYNSTTATCASGVLVGGGYSTTVAGTPSSIMRIFSDGRTSSTSSSWQVSAYNTTGSMRSVTSYAYCLNDTSFAVSQTSGTLSPEGIATASCTNPLHTLGGGFTFPRTTAYYVATMDNEGSAYAVDMLPGPVYPDPNAKAYAQCLYDPAPPPVCTEETATDIGAEHAIFAARGDSCLKVTQYPGSWVRSVVLQAQGNGSGYPIPFTWTNCANGGDGSITGNWTQSTLNPVSNTCTTLIDLNGSSSASVSLTWWANG
jgi:hypothetical protein